MLLPKLLVTATHSSPTPSPGNDGGREPRAILWLKLMPAFLSPLLHFPRAAAPTTGGQRKEENLCGQQQQK